VGKKIRTNQLKQKRKTDTRDYENLRGATLSAKKRRQRNRVGDRGGGAKKEGNGVFIASPLPLKEKCLHSRMKSVGVSSAGGK